MKKSLNSELLLSRVGLRLVFAYCLLASIFFSYFAQMHLSLSFLPFPIFVSEIVIFLCIPLLAWVCRDGRLLKPRTVFLLGLYFGWVVVKALINYHYDGPLALRNAALFYYPSFAVFTYCFYRKADIPRDALMALAFLAAFIMFFKFMVVWYWWTYVLLFVIAVWNIRPVKWRWVGWASLVGILLLGKEYFYQGPRAHMVGIFLSLLFLVFYFGALFVKCREFLRLGILLCTLIFFFLGYSIFAERSSVTSLTSIQGLINTYKKFDHRYQQEQANYVPEKLTTQLYNPKDFYASYSLEVSSKDIRQSRIREGRQLDVDENDIVFRLFVWRDMARELIQQRAWWGFSFGHPQRSRSLEVLNWAKPEWSRDGWITPHNSFLHIIYRAGILGIIFIGVFIFMVCRLIADFFRLNSIEGGLLVAALIYWIILSNFFVILEFPYNAIVFWSLFGLTLAYRDSLCQ